MKIRKKLAMIFNQAGSMDLSIYFVVFFLIAFGVIMVYSSSFNVLVDESGKKLNLLSQFWVKQMIFGGIGLLAMMIIPQFNTKLMTGIFVVLYPVTLLLLVLVRYFGESNRGATRAFNLGPVSFQPSELTKLVVIITLAFLIGHWQKHLSKTMALLYLLIILAIPTALVAIEDFSTAAVIAVIGGGMIWISYKKMGQTLLLGGLGTGAILTYFFLKKENRSQRWDVYASGPWAQADGKGRQAVQSLYAIGSGGFFGRGLGQSLQKMGRISQAHHDIIFAIICEELGFFGAGLILLLYLGLCYQLLQTAMNTSEIKDYLIVIGVMIQIAVQVIINIGVASNVLPNTGMPLPFISYGGSSLVILCVEMAMVLGITKKNQYNYLKRLEQYQEEIEITR
ncbi:FtsW/RodA/SpoVE family cell cycle protein [Clostridiales bacterium COT073_COT-073]|nr:FtsW/RodA/SpoVE family cell cycle protein [Clostridiales bacterium COT073_COT-073]